MRRLVSLLAALVLLVSAASAAAKATATGKVGVVKDGIRSDCELGDANAIPFAAPRGVPKQDDQDLRITGFGVWRRLKSLPL